jgi:hypothetical protein
MTTSKSGFYGIDLQERIEDMVDHQMTWDNIRGKTLNGIMEDDSDLWLFFKKGSAVRVSSADRRHNWTDNFYLSEVTGDWPERDSRYKMIGETVTDVRSEFYELDKPYVVAHMDTWIADVGEGEFNPEEGEPHQLVTIATPSKRIDFTTEYYNCHYPDSLWEVLE